MKSKFNIGPLELIVIIYATVAILVGGLIGVGWVFNIITLTETSLDPLTGLAILRVVGIFIPPLGGILGYIP